MTGDADIAAVASLVGDRRRAAMLLALADGRSLPASLLAAEAGVAPSTASEHLAQLLDGGLVSAERSGRHRYYRAAPAVGELLEVLARVAPPQPVRSLRQATRAEAIRRARTCYDHLAGRLGVALMRALLDRNVLAPCEAGYELTAPGASELSAFGVDLEAVSRSRRRAIRHCVDWSERRHHLSGGLGAALATRIFELGWVEHLPRTRAVAVTPAGERGLAETFGLAL